MLSILLTLSAFPGFLGFGPNPSLLDVTNRFGNPITVDQSDDKRIQSFTYTRESYLLTAISDKTNKVLTLQAYGLNKSVKYKNVGLMSDFKSVIKNFGNPQKYVFNDNGFDIVYPDCVFTLVKIGRKSYHQVVGISVNMKQEPTQSGKK
jgi:hypothetical protein